MTGFKIERVHLFVVTEHDGTEGLPGYMQGSLWMPLLGADETRVDLLEQTAHEIVRQMAESGIDQPITPRIEHVVMEQRRHVGWIT